MASISAESSSKMTVTMNRSNMFTNDKRSTIIESSASNQISSNVKKKICAQGVKPKFPVLTPQMKVVIDDILMFGPSDEIVCEDFDLTREDLRRLCGQNFLNDHVINAYMHLIMERSKQDNFPSVFAFTTFFYPKLSSGGHSVVRRWTKKVDIFSYDLILVPVISKNHWSLAVIDFKAKQIKYYDSVHGNNYMCFLMLSSYLKDESLDKKKHVFDATEWAYKNMKSIPKQKNTSDCGVFILKYADYVSRNTIIDFTQENLGYLKKCMIYELIVQKLL